MSVLVPCPTRTNFDKYATSKSNAQFFLNAGLLAETAMDLYLLSGGENGTEKRLWIWLIVLTTLSLLIEIVGLILSLILAFCKYPCHKVPETELATRLPGDQPADDIEVVKKCPHHLRYMNDSLTALMFILMVLVAIKNALRSNYDFTEAPSIETTSSPLST